MAQVHERAGVLWFKLEFHQRRARRQQPECFVLRLPSPGEGYAAKRRHLRINATRDVASADLDLKNPARTRVERMEQADPLCHQRRIDEKAEHDIGRRRDENLAFDYVTLGHRCRSLRPAAWAASFSCAR